MSGIPLLTLTLVAAAGCAADPAAGGGAPGDVASQSDALGAQYVDQFQKLYEQAQKNGETSLVVWDGAAVPNEKLYAAFMKRFPAITIEAQQVNAGDMLTKLNAEQSAGRRSADIAATGSTAMIQGAKDGNFQSYAPFTAEHQKGDPVQSDPDNFFRQYKVGPKGIVYNTSLVKPDEVPKGWDALLEPRWSGTKMAIRNPTINGGGNELVSDMLYDGRYDYDYFEKLAGQGLKIVAGSAEITNAVATGQVQLGFPANYDNYVEQKEKGAPLGYVWPTEGGVELSELYIGIVKDAPHPTAAQLYEAWVFTPEGVRALNEIGDYSPSEQVPDNAPEGLPPYRNLDAFKAYPIGEALTHQKGPIARLKTIFV